MEYKIAYHISKDYANLYELIRKKYRIPAWIIDDNLTKIVEVKMPCSNTGYYKIGTPGIGYEDFSNTKKKFIKHCEKLKLEYIIPNRL